jgi:hypothetical protein
MLAVQLARQLGDLQLLVRDQGLVGKHAVKTAG